MSRVFDYPMRAFCWLAYRLVLIMPIDWRLWKWLLPYAGFYAYHESWLPWRWSEHDRERRRAATT